MTKKDACASRCGKVLDNVIPFHLDDRGAWGYGTHIIVKEYRVAKKHSKTEPKEPKQQVNRLLHFVELLQQTLEVKLDALYLFPFFLHASLLHHSSQRVTRELAEMGEQIVSHVQVLTHLVSNLGGTPSDAQTPSIWDQHQEPISAMLFQEELCAQILQECERLLQHDWDTSSQLKAWLSERLETVLSETLDHIARFDEIFAKTEPRYRDLVVERFRVTAIP